jgi:hypothetical protein
MFFFSVSVLRLKRLPLVVSVLCVLCVSVVKNPLFVAVLHRTRMVAARMSTTPCSLGARYSINVRHQFEAFSALHASLISVGAPSLHDMHIFDVNKCTYLYRQPAPPTLRKLPENAFNVAKCGSTSGRAVLQRSHRALWVWFIPHRSLQCGGSRDNAYPPRSTDVVLEHPVVHSVKSSHILATANRCAIIYTVSP